MKQFEVTFYFINKHDQQEWDCVYVWGDDFHNAAKIAQDMLNNCHGQECCIYSLVEVNGYEEESVI